ncbi:AI-2E family transporter [Halomarina rubra]|uniref:AI-2E family transporter n=1 Tax=Halomarina rubra TaxID=2071873 RepID=A0ABD6AXB3_9EURY|nr:AI-2E family transporter [Halomarina rubra]
MSLRSRLSKSTLFLWGLLAVFGGLSVLLVVAYLQFVLLAGLLGYVIYPVSARLKTHLGRTIGAGVTFVLSLVAVVAPVAFVVVVALGQARSILDDVTRSSLVNAGNGLLDELGVGLDTMDVVAMLTDAMRAGSRGLLGNAYALLGSVTDFLIGLVVFFFLLYYLLRDGDRLVAWTRSVTPLSPAETDDLFARLDRLLWASVVGTVVVAAVQATLTGITFSVLGFANAVFWTLVTFLVSLLPVVGASVVWIPAVGYLLLVERTVDALVLLVVGSVVISGSDNVVRPLVVQRSAHLNTGLVVVGIFGGLAVLGVLGLFVGPVVVGLAKYLAELLADRHGVNGEVTHEPGTPESGGEE